MNITEIKKWDLIVDFKLCRSNGYIFKSTDEGYCSEYVGTEANLQWWVWQISQPLNNRNVLTRPNNHDFWWASRSAMVDYSVR